MMRAGWIAAATTALGLATGAPAAAAWWDCAIARLEGAPVELWAAGLWRAAETGPMAEGVAKLRTGGGARVEIVCAQGLVVTVAPETEVNLASLTEGPPAGAFLQIVRGLIGLVLERPAARPVEIRGPLAIAAARSTEWLGEVPPAGGTAFFVSEGAVGVRPSGAAAFPPATLGPGEGITVAADGSAGPVVEWGAARVTAARAALGFGWR